MERKNIKLVSSQQTVIEPPLRRTISVRRSRRAPPRICYYKKVCIDCDLILGIQWKREFPIKLLDHFAQITMCQFCSRSHIAISEINREEYYKINLAWDLDDLQLTDEESNVIEGFWDVSR